MAIVLPNGKNYFTTNAGTPAVGYKVYTYVAGTSTPKDTYTTSAASVANTNPIILNSRGEAAIYWNGTYDVVLKTDADVTVWGPERMYAPDLADWMTEADLANTGTVGLGDALVGVKRIESGGSARTQHSKNNDIMSVLDFGAVGDGTTNDTTAIQNAINAALATATTANPGLVLIPAGTYKITSTIDINDSAGTGNYRPSVRIIGAGQKRSILLNNVGGPTFRHQLTQTQGDNSYFSRGLELAHFSIEANGSTPAGSIGIQLQGVYFPWIHDVLITGMLSHGIDFPVDARFSGPDKYSCADAIIERSYLMSCGAYGINNKCFSTVVKALNCYIISNASGGLYLEGSNHVIMGGAVAGNGTSGLTTSAGIQFVRTSDGTPQNYVIDNVEIDNNWVNQIRTSGTVGRITHNRFIDSVSAGAFRAPTQILVEAISGASADANEINLNSFRFDNQAAANVTMIKFNLDVADGSRTVRYNIADRNIYTANGVTTGVVTECDRGSNPTSVHSAGNRFYTNASPKGTVTSGTFTKNIADASTSQSITGLGFRPSSVRFLGGLNQMFMTSEVDSSDNARGFYYYPTGTAWGSTGTNALTFRTGAGDEQDGVVALNDDGFTITWTKTGAPTGTVTVNWLATR